ncbi:MAG TPA: cytidylate kinase-like family protein [Acidobacteriota bacterium]|nr:cytidylate kinase-like family protein [Acidobacteriota bacterium]
MSRSFEGPYGGGYFSRCMIPVRAASTRVISAPGGLRAHPFFNIAPPERLDYTTPEVIAVPSIDSIINRQLLRWELQRKAAEESKRERPRPQPIVTTSRQTGSRGSYFASRLAGRLNYQRLHREAIDAICKSSGHRKRIIEALDERSRSDLRVLVESLFTGHAVNHSDYLRHLSNVVLSMSRLGGVVVMGRGASFILGPGRGFHIRVVCPREKRIENLIKYVQLSEKDAARQVDTLDEQRRNFIRKVFGKDIDCPLNYDVVMNSAMIDVEEMVDMAVTAMHAKMDKLTHLEHDEF